MIGDDGLGSVKWRKGQLDGRLLIKFVDNICKTTFEERYLSLLGIDYYSLSEHLLSLLFSSNVFKDRFEFSPTYFSTRLITIRANSKKVRDLSLKYNKAKFDDFMSQKENLILFEYFLENAKKHMIPVYEANLVVDK